MEYIDMILKRTQEITRNILGVINPVKSYELPVIVFALRAILTTFEKAMTEEQKMVANSLQYLIGSETHITDVRRYRYSNGSVTEIDEEDGK